MKNSEPIKSSAEKTSPKKWHYVSIWAFLFLFLIVMGIILYRSLRGNINVGDRVPDFSLQTYDGQTINLSSLSGKVVIINFWASWCDPCADEAVWLERAWQRYHSSGDVAFIGIVYVDTEPDVRNYLHKYSITYPNGADLGTRISQLFSIRGVPETYILDQEGVLIYHKIGPFSSYEEIINVINPLLPKS